MGKGLGRRSPALLVACVALFAALGGSVYAATKIDGHTVRAKSLPGNRLVPGSTPGNRLKAGTVTANLLAPGSIPGAKVDTATIGQVPSAAHADSADSARDAETALNAVNAIDAKRVNGHSVGCAAGTRFFAGACWQTTISEAALTAPAAVIDCANQGGELPTALALAAFSRQPGITLAGGDEWSGDITNMSGENLYAVVTVTSGGSLNYVLSNLTKQYRCVIPLVT